MSADGTIVITGAEKIEGARVLAVRSALSLEIKGLRRSRGKSARQLANEITGQDDRTARKAYETLNAYIVKTYGEQFNRPLPPRAPRQKIDQRANSGLNGEF